MCWLKNDIWKVGIALAGTLLLLVLMAWITVSAADAQERVSGLATSVTVQATPTEDATVTALNKEKLAQEVQQLKNQNEPDPLGWLQTNAAILLSTLVVVGGGLFGFWRWRGDQRTEREKRDEERFQNVVEGFGSDKEEAKVGAAIVLLTFLGPDYKQFYRQAFDLAVAHLRLPRTPSPPEDPDGLAHILKGSTFNPPEDSNIPPPLASLSQALIAVFTRAFPLIRDELVRNELRKGGKEKPFDPRHLNATHIQLDNALLWEADLERVWLAWASLQGADLSEAHLGGAWLWRSDLRGAKLRKAHLRGADLGQDKLNRADLSEACLCGATLWGADLSEADLSGADLSEADLSKDQLFLPSRHQGKLEATLFLADLRDAKLYKAKLQGADLRGADLREADLREADLREANLSGANLRRADLRRADLRNAKLMGLQISGTDLLKAKLTKAKASQVKLPEVYVSQVKLTEVYVSQVKLTEVDRSASYWDTLRWWADRIQVNAHGAELLSADPGAELLSADLTEADLTEANLSGADLRGVCNLEDAVLKGTNLRGVKGLTKEQLEACKAKGAIIDEDATTSSSQSTVSPPPPS